ncbi:MAG: winged helix-turn-helix domain-containing protein [Woeseiaceae bacterium]|nr:winged helix-turn-helix domain-containing protein [Woeseiaceae bacterium]
MSKTGSGSIYEFGGWRLAPGQRQLISAEGEPAALRSKVFDLLVYLVQERGRVVAKTELMEAVWPDAVVEENNLNQAISALRQALGDTAQAPRFVATVTGRGYQFIGEVREIDSRAPEEPGKPSSALRYGIAGAAIIAALIGAWMARPGDAPPAAAGIAVLEQFAELEPILVTDFKGSQSEATLSPDGTMIAWISESSGTPQVWMKNLQSGEPLQITNGPYAASSPTWSPDNSYIVYARKSDGPRAIYRVGTLGTPPPQRILDAGLNPSFALATNAFVFTNDRDLFVADGDGSNVRQVDAVPSGPGFARREPALSPDATMVAFIQADEGPLGNLYIAPVEDGEARQLTHYTLEEGLAADSPTWMPDGRHIVYSVMSSGGSSRLWRIDIQTGEALPLTAGGGNASEPVVSSDGRRLAYTDTRLSWRITSIDPEDDQRRTIYETRHVSALPIASPDGSKIVFFSMLPSGAQIFTIGVDGQGLRQWTFDENGTNTLPFWSGDGASVFYYKDRALHRIYLDEGRDELVLPDFHWSSKNWAAEYGDRLYYNHFDGSRGFREAVIKDLVTGEEVTMPVAIVAAEWSATGDELLGFAPEDGLYICDAATLDCKAIMNAGEQVKGRRPKWSRDGERVYYIRHSEKGECCMLRSVHRDGSSITGVAELTGFDLRSSYFGVAHDGTVFYNHPDTSMAEIWLVAAE